MIESHPNLGIILLYKTLELTKFKRILEKLRSVLASEIDFENEKYPFFDSSLSLAP